MEPRHKKLIFALGFVPFIILYMGLALWIWDQLPDHRAVDFIFFVAAGVAWAFPLKPFMKWMNSPAG
ncbi:DUF2842 domain-containing protein [Parvularcula maris]|uniref:DUF2842 domain-containing protein n=1 Tax=Parvularcula maris TaxID=2965077 RepID=A0A9X2RKS2_9PROT|nr:DUF2842 domain-containing protein [Parvularcula maris]MCQ8185897.1 DUF2842 domain-containing protein [Parvularcula maris]